MKRNFQKLNFHAFLYTKKNNNLAFNLARDKTDRSSVNHSYRSTVFCPSMANTAFLLLQYAVTTVTAVFQHNKNQPLPSHQVKPYHLPPKLQAEHRSDASRLTDTKTCLNFKSHPQINPLVSLESHQLL